MAVEANRYRFGPYEVHPRTRGLYKHGVRVKLRPQPFHVLELLLERPGDVVTREELRRKLWPAKTFVDFERGLNTSIKELRQALCDSVRTPQYIETLPRLGYRMLATVASVSAGEDAAGIELEPRPPAAGPRANTQPPAQRLAILAGALVLGLALVGTWEWRRLWSRPRIEDARTMLAVLPFENLTGNPADEYLSDGLTEELITQLGRLNPESFGVIARTSAMHYKHKAERVGQIGRELNVQYVLEGSLRREAPHIRVAVQLIRVKDETHTWARQYDREWSGPLALEAEVAREVSDEIRIALGAPPPKRLVERPKTSAHQSEADDLYLKGLYFWNKRTTDDFRRAIEYFQHAIAEDPNHAPAYAGMADCYAMLGGYSAEVRPEYMMQARTAALRALELNPNLPEAHTALAVIVQNYDHDWQTAGNEYRRAIELNPSYAMAHHWYAEHLGFLGHFEEALQESERARRLDPLSLIIAVDNGVLLIYSRQYDRALRKCRSVLDLDPGFGMAEGCVVRVYRLKGMFAEALHVYQTVGHDFADPPWKWSELAYLYGRSGQRGQALQALERVKQLYRPQQTDPAVFVGAYIGLAQTDQTFAWLEKAYKQHSNTMATLKVDPLFDPLRANPQFQDLLRRVGLTP